MLPPDTKVGKYEIRAELGRGAMGIVYVAYDSVLDRDVALKVMAGAIVADPDLEVRFRKEAQAVAKLQSPHIVTVHDFGYHDQAPYIAMELLSGTDLEARMRSSPPSLSTKINIVIQICQGLAHAHQQGIVHRDIKPANIFLTDGGLVKIMDFGTARLVQSTQTQTGTVMGTVAYMSPEQIQGLKVDGRSDIFSLGVLFYRLLCHQQPFGGENVHHIIYKILNVKQASLVLPQGAAMPELQRIVDKALAKDLAERYQTADMMAADLSTFLHESSSSLAEDTVFGTLSGEMPGIPQPGSGAAGTIPVVPHDQAMGTVPISGGVAAGKRDAGSHPSLGTQPASYSPPTNYDSVPTNRTRGLQPSDSGLQDLEGETIKTERLPPGINPYEQPAVAGRGAGLPWIVAGILVVAMAAGGGYFFSRTSDSRQDRVLDQMPSGTSPIAEPGATETSDVLSPDTDLAAENIANREDPSNATVDTQPPTQTTTAARDSAQESDSAPPPSVPATSASTRPPSVSGSTTTAPPPSAPPPRPRQEPSTQAPSAAGQSRSKESEAEAKVNEVRLALASGQLGQAQLLIDEGRRLTPNDSVWDRLDQRRLVEDFNQRGDTLLGEGVDFLTAGKSAKAVAAFDEAEKSFQQAKLLEPSNRASLEGIVTANRLLKDARAEREAARLPSRQFQASETTFETPGSDAPTGFQTGDVQVGQATSEETSPAEVTIEVVPVDAKPGEPYSLRIRLRNISHQAIFAQSLEVVSTFKGKKIGQGRPKELNRRRIDAQGSVILFERNDQWSEELDQGGEIMATIVLADRRGTLTKTLQWVTR